MSDITISPMNLGHAAEPNYAVYVRGARVGTVGYAGRGSGFSHYRYLNRPGIGTLWSERTYTSPIKAAWAFVQTVEA